MLQVFVWMFEKEGGGWEEKKEIKWVSVISFACKLLPTYAELESLRNNSNKWDNLCTHGHFTYWNICLRNDYLSLEYSIGAACVARLLIAPLVSHDLHILPLIKSCLEYWDGKCVGILHIVWLIFRNLYFEWQNDSWVGGNTEWFMDCGSQIHRCNWRKTTKKGWWRKASGLR